jgi:di/tricarboxylate transporter
VVYLAVSINQRILGSQNFHRAAEGTRADPCRSRSALCSCFRGPQTECVLLRSVRRVVIALILEPIPAAAVGLVGVTAATVSILVVPNPADAIKWALSGFQDGMVWLIFAAFMLALGYEKTGLGRRVALNLVKWLGKRTL